MFRVGLNDKLSTAAATNCVASQDVENLVNAIITLELSPPTLNTEYGYPSLVHCMVDAVFSIGVRYASVQATMKRFVAASGLQLSDRVRGFEQRGTSKVTDFLALAEMYSVEELTSKFFGNRQRTSTRSGILKSEACIRFAKALVNAGVNDFPDLVSIEARDFAMVNVMSIPGQRSGVSFGYFMMLAGDDDRVKPDRMVIRFVAQSIFEDFEKVSQKRAALLVRLASHELAKRTSSEWTPIKLDHAIWQHARSF